MTTNKQQAKNEGQRIKKLEHVLSKLISAGETIYDVAELAGDDGRELSVNAIDFADFIEVLQKARDVLLAGGAA